MKINIKFKYVLLATIFAAIVGTLSKIYNIKLLGDIFLLLSTILWFIVVYRVISNFLKK